jgi:hypothetical protein
MQADQAKGLGQLETENAARRSSLAGAELDKGMLETLGGENTSRKPSGAPARAPAATSHPGLAARL